MKQLFHSLVFKIGATIILAEIIVLAIVGFVYVERFANEVDKRIKAQMQLPGTLINAGLLKYESVAERETMTQLVDEELVEGMLIGVNKNIFYSLDPADLGRNVAEIPELDTTLFDVNNPHNIVVYGDKDVICVSPIFAADKRTPRFFAYVKVKTSEAMAEKAALTWLFILGSAATVISTSAIIILSFNRTIFTRITDVLRILERVKVGDLTARLDAPISKDEIGSLQRGVNLMTAELQDTICSLKMEIAERVRVGEELRHYREHLEELVEERTRELREAQAELLRRERLSALGQLTATVAHEIRNPLGTVRTAVFAIDDALKRDELHRLERARQLAERNILRCDRIIGELLDYTRERALKLELAEIDPWLDALLDEQTFPKDIACVRKLDAGAQIPLDREHLRRAVVNVVENAVDALQEEGKTGNELTVSSHVVGSRLEIRISDTGPGIPADMLNKVFEPLFSTKAFGVGLGLPIVESIMQQHGGGVEIQSKIGEPGPEPVKGGTMVTLWMPMPDNGGD